MNLFQKLYIINHRIYNKYIRKIKTIIDDFDISPKPKIRKINTETKDLQKINTNIHRLDAPHESAEEISWSSTSSTIQESFEEKEKEKTPIKSPTKFPKCKRVPFSKDEVKYLMDGVKKYGKGNWSEILKNYPFHKKRSSVDLKDKYRNLMK